MSSIIFHYATAPNGTDRFKVNILETIVNSGFILNIIIFSNIN